MFGQQSNQIGWKRKIRAITPFNFIEVGTNRKPICDFLLVINSNWQPISYRCGVIAAYRSNFGHFAFLSHRLGSLATTYRLFRAQRWHVQFLVIWTFWFQVTTISQTFLVHKNFQLFSAVLVANEHTHFGDMSSFVQDLTKNDCTKVTWWTCHLCALQVFGFAQHKGDMSMVDT